MTRITNQSKSCEGLTKDSCTIFCVARWDCRAACQNVSTRCHLLKDFEWEDLVSNKNREILRSVLSFKTRKLLSNQHFGRPTLQKLRQCPLDLSSARSLLGPTPSPNFHKIPDRWATSFNELQWASMSFNESELAAHHIPSQAPCRNLRTQLWWSRQWQPWSDVSGAGGPWLRFVLRQVAELANSGALTAPDEAAEITSLGRWSFANLHDDDDNILYYYINIRHIYIIWQNMRILYCPYFRCVWPSKSKNTYYYDMQVSKSLPQHSSLFGARRRTKDAEHDERIGRQWTLLNQWTFPYLSHSHPSRVPFCEFNKDVTLHSLLRWS
jgi:hypothetical protein